ncbi:hypothetical protein MACH16_18010 [Marinomonas pontica]|uniref:Uncharacterized protein n=1 Tax=Marinomonas pontica TaxID=264739 RepID=A0ABN6WPX5_9GAMM|nr:hypothetical protein MACH16_18010 [Marinomonas pontica]
MYRSDSTPTFALGMATSEMEWTTPTNLSILYCIKNELTNRIAQLYNLRFAQKHLTIETLVG